MMYDYRGYKYRLENGATWVQAIIYLPAIRKFRKKFWAKPRPDETYWKHTDGTYFEKGKLGRTPEERVAEAHKRTQDYLDAKIKAHEEEERFKSLLDDPKMEFMGKVMK